MKNFNKLCAKIILEETTKLNKTKVKSIIKSALTGNYRNIKALGNGYSFEILVVKPVIIKDEPQHQKNTNKFEITFDIVDDKLNLTCTFNDKSKEKSIKMTYDVEKLQETIEKFVSSSVSSLRK